jgi:hypothetical protein
VQQHVLNEGELRSRSSPTDSDAFVWIEAEVDEKAAGEGLLEEVALDGADDENCDDDAGGVFNLEHCGIAFDERVTLSDQRGHDGSFAKRLPSHTWHLTGLPLLCSRTVGPPPDEDGPVAVELIEDDSE